MGKQKQLFLKNCNTIYENNKWHIINQACVTYEWFILCTFITNVFQKCEIRFSSVYKRILNEIFHSHFAEKLVMSERERFKYRSLRVKAKPRILPFQETLYQGHFDFYMWKSNSLNWILKHLETWKLLERFFFFFFMFYQGAS